MKNKIGITIFALIFGLIIWAIPCYATTQIEENVEDYTEDVYIIGATKFDANQIITATKAAKAGINEAKLNLILGNDISNLGITTYYYNAILKEWYEINETTGIVELKTQEEVNNIEENLNIFFVNNEEKIIEYVYNAKVDEGSITNGVTYDGSKFILPATTLGFSFTSNGTEITVKASIGANGQKNLTYGQLYISSSVTYYNESKTKLGKLTNITSGNTNVIEELFSYTKEGYDLVYTDAEGNIIDFSVPIISDMSVYQKWIPAEKLEVESNMNEKVELQYNGILYLNENNQNEVIVKLYAPKDFDTSATKIEGLTDDFNTLKEYDATKKQYYVTVPLVFEDKMQSKPIKVTWQEDKTTTYEVTLGENAKFERLVSYFKRKSADNTEESQFATEKVIAGNTVQKGLTYKPELKGYLFSGWKVNGKPFDIENTVITENTQIYAVFKAKPVLDVTEVKAVPKGKECEFTISIDAKEFGGETVLLSGENRKDILSKIPYSDSDYIKVYKDGEWVKLENYEITLDSAKENNTIRIKQKVTNAARGNNYYTYFVIKQNDNLLASSSKKKTLMGEAVAQYDGYYLDAKEFTTNLSKYADKEITVIKDFDVTKQTIITKAKNYVINLNGHKITGANDVNILRINTSGATLTLKNGTLEVKGTGGAIDIGTYQDTVQRNIHVTIEQDVKVIGEHYGIGIYGRGSVLNFNGQMEITQKGYGITGNGSEKNQDTTIHVGETAIITANSGIGLYLPQYGTVNIKGTIKAYTPISIKAGIINMTSGSLIATGATIQVPEETDNGTNPTGDAIYVEVNDNYAKNIAIHITGGDLSSNHGYLIRKYQSNSTEDITVTGKYMTENIIADNPNMSYYTE